MRRDALSGLVLAALLTTTAALAADTLDLARRLVRYTGGVTLLLRNTEPGLAASVPAPDVFAQSFEQAMQDNKGTIQAADDQIARVYAGLYPAAQMAAEVGFYESPEGKDIMDKNRAPSGQVIWPDPGAVNLTAEESGALRKFNAIVKQRAAVAAQNPKAMDQVLSAETNVLVKVRAAAYADYCKVRDCKTEGVKLPP